MILSALPTTLAKSSLEEMLESLRRQDECDPAKDTPPALPIRPNSRARLPSASRSLPTNFSAGNVIRYGKDAVIAAAGVEGKVKEKNLKVKRKNFGSKKMKTEPSSESPYTAAENKTEEPQKSPENKTEEPQKSPESKWNDKVEYFMKKKLYVWCWIPNGEWQYGMIQSTTGDDSLVKLANGNVMKVSTNELFPANPKILEGIEDLKQLSYLNEPSVLYNIRIRYSQDLIYSKAGPVLIAVNPFKNVSVVQQKALNNPHVYSMADEAYNDMMRDDKNQSIIISGESGSGKTETAKFAMRYLAARGKSNRGIENEILKTNFILEAFGNAKTSINSNSSRFGKLIEIHFSTTGTICGAKIEAFLLEKSRVVQLSNGERSYHIFYELCAGASPSLRERFNLKMANEYKYLNQSDCLTIDGVDDAQMFHELTEAFDTVKIPKEHQHRVFALLAAILWIGNISFRVIDDENHVEVVTDEAVINAAMLMGCNLEELISVLSTRKIQIGSDFIVKRLALRQAIDTRDALAKFIYTSLFYWLVERINDELRDGKSQRGNCISILDIYGFESFKNNSFEQLCINYANERLQQHFNRHLFKLEQEEYEMDGIDWTKIEFDDNQDCLDLIEKKHIGLLSLLDEESNNPNATDLTFVNKLKQRFKANRCFKEENGRAFGIHHYAGEVRYDTNGFLEKNRDPFYADLIQLLSSCNCQLPDLFPTKESETLPMLSDSTNQSIGTMFKDQLFKLMNKLENTTPHFICCIKPNSKNLPGLFEDNLVLQQLRCYGILEVVRISRSVYPTRLTHQEFAQRYGFLLLDTKVSRDPLSISIDILKYFNILPEMFQVGYTKLYLRTGQIGILENRRNVILQVVVTLQKRFRGWRCRQYFQQLKNGAMLLQSYIRGENGRRKYVIEANMRAAAVSRVIKEELTVVIYLQSVVRGWLVRKQFNNVQCRNENSEKRNSNKRISEDKDLRQERLQFQASAMAELQKRIQTAEAALVQKEKENTALQEQLRQFEARWSDNETKMSSMEESWQKQVAALQMSLAAVRNRLIVDNNGCHSMRPDTSRSTFVYDSEDTLSVGTGMSTPTVFANVNQDIRINDLAREFEQRKFKFDEDVRSLTDRQHPDEELKKLKLMFKTWRREYKAKLRETKARLHRRDGHKGRRRNWWGLIKGSGLKIEQQ